MSQRTVLVVDDEPMIRMVLADVLEDEGYLVIEASNVLEAVAVLGNRHVDCLVTDIDMPGGLNGLDLVKFVRGFDASMVIVVTSGECRTMASFRQTSGFVRSLIVLKL